MSKYRDDVLKILSKDVIKSTNEVLVELEAKSGKKINWHNLYRILLELAQDGQIDQLKARAGFFWKKK